MQDPTRRKLLGLAATAPVASGLFTASTTRAGTRPDDAREKIHQRYFPDVVLRTQDNKKVRFYQDLIKDKIVTLNFFYAKCEGVCPAITANLVKVQRLLGERVGREIFMYSITLKPEQDTPGALKDYMGMCNIKPGWRLLTRNAGD